MTMPIRPVAAGTRDTDLKHRVSNGVPDGIPEKISDALPGVLPMDEMLCFLVYSSGLALNRAYRKPLAALGLTYPQYIVMIALWTEDGLTVGQISDRLRLDSGTLTPLLKRLEALGLVTRRRTAADERRVAITLTVKGSALRTHAAEVTRCMLGHIAMPADDIDVLMQHLRRLRANLDKAAATV